MEQDKEREILLKVVKHPFITTTVLAHSCKQNAPSMDKMMEKFKKLGYVKLARQGHPKSWNITDAGIEKYDLQKETERKLPPRHQDDRGKGRGQGNNQRRGNQNRGNNRGNNQDRGNNRRKDDRSKGNNQGRGNNQKGRGNQSSKNRSKNNNEDTGNNQQNSQDNNAEGEQRPKGSRRDRQEKINELFLFFKEHSEHSFTAKEIAPEFHNISVRHLNSLLYELLSYGDVMKIFDQDEQQLVWYLADCHLEAAQQE